MKEITADSLSRVVIAYEPVWAIGTGKAAYPEDAAQASRTIREAVDEISKGMGSRLQILYGGSVKSNNIAGFVALEEIQGALVGGASLKADSFLELIKAAQEAG